MIRTYGLLGLVAYALMLGAPMAHGQSMDKTDQIGAGKLSIGARVGLSIATHDSNMPFVEGFDNDYRTDFTFGAVAKMTLYRPPKSLFSFEVRSEISYTGKGVTFSLDGDPRGRFYMDYIDIPLLLQTSIDTRTGWTPYVTVGPALGILLDVDLENSLGELSDDTDAWTRMDFGIVFGTGVAYELDAIKGAIVADARYQLGLRDVRTTTLDIKNRGFAFTLGYEYHIW